MSPRYPEPVAITRHVDPVRWARGGDVHRVTVRLTNGRCVRFHEACAGGLVTVCASRREAFDVLRHTTKGST
jgi:hypothetical protein